MGGEKPQGGGEKPQGGGGHFINLRRMTRSWAKILGWILWLRNGGTTVLRWPFLALNRTCAWLTVIVLCEAVEGNYFYDRKSQPNWIHRVSLIELWMELFSSINFGFVLHYNTATHIFLYSCCIRSNAAQWLGHFEVTGHQKVKDCLHTCNIH